MPLPVCGRVPHAVHGAGPRPAAQGDRRGRRRATPRCPVDLQRRRPRPRPGRRVGEPALGAAVAARCAGSSACIALDDAGRHRLRRARPRRRAHRHGQAHGRRRAGRSRCATPDDLDKLLEFIAGADHAAPSPATRASTSSPTERLVVSPAAGRLHARSGDRSTGHDDRGRRRCSATSATTRCARRSPACCRATSPSTASGSRCASPSPGCARRDTPVRPRAPARGASSPAGAPPCPTRSSPTTTSSDDGHQRRVDRRAHRHPASAASAAPPPACRSRPAAPALEMAGRRPGARSTLLVLATTTPDQHVPATAPTVQHELGLRCGAFDVNAACSGLRLRPRRGPRPHRHRAPTRSWSIGTDTLSRITDWDDRSTADPLRRRLRRGRARSRRRRRASCSAGTSTPTAPPQPLLYADVGGYIQMDGKEVFRRAVRIMVDSARSRWRTPASPPTTSRWSCPTRPTSASSRRPATGSASRWSGPRRSSTAPATRRRRRSRSPSPTRSTHGRVARRRPRPARRLRRRHDGGQRGAPVGRRVTEPPSEPRTVLVTGGSRGIGLACAQGFAAVGDRVAVTYRDEAAARRPLRREVRRHQRPTSTPPSRPSRSASGRSRCSCPTPASPSDGLLLRMSEDDFTRVVDANLTGAFRVAKRAAPGMLRARAGPDRSSCRRSSASSARPARRTTRRRRPASSASPARSPASSAPRHHRQRRRARAVATDMTAALRRRTAQAELTAAVPLGRFGHARRGRRRRRASSPPTDAGYITGAVIPVDGGLGMGH